MNTTRNPGFCYCGEELVLTERGKLACPTCEQIPLKCVCPPKCGEIERPAWHKLISGGSDAPEATL